MTADEPTSPSDFAREIWDRLVHVPKDVEFTWIDHEQVISGEFDESIHEWMASIPLMTAEEFRELISPSYEIDEPVAWSKP